MLDGGSAMLEFQNPDTKLTLTDGLREYYVSRDR